MPPPAPRRTPHGSKPVQRDRLSWHQFSAEPTRYDRMIYRPCGRWGLKLPAISLGAWETFGGYRGPETARECIFRAFNLGITHFDLANNYGKPPGRAETMVGRILVEMPRDELIISTKAGYLMWPGPYGDWGSRKSLMVSIDQSLQRLGLDYVDIFYSHRPDPNTPLEETIGALNDVVRQGKALYAGLSNYSGASLREVCALTERKNWAPTVIHQPRYSMLSRGIEEDLLQAARETGTGVITFSPLAQGLLSGKYLAGIPEDSRAAVLWNDEQRSRVTPAVVESLRQLNGVAQERGQTLAQMALAWILRNPEVTSVLTGASDVSQVEENIAALANLNFSAEELMRIDTILGASNGA